MTTSAYQHLHDRKRTWSPVAVTAGQLLQGGEDAVKRGLSLRSLEIPVGDFISEAMKGDLPDDESCKQLLLSNVEDEINHDIALNYAAKAHQVSAQYDAEAEVIKQSWLDLDCHPLLKAVVLERSVFFVLLPMFRYLGDTGLRTTSADISRDEQTHVAANTLVCQQMKLGSNQALNKLRRATIGWVMQSLPDQHDNRYLSKVFWMNQSDSLYSRGKAEGLAQTRVARAPAFFECSNNDLPQYAT